MPFESMPEDILDFVDTYVESFVSWDIVSYFHESPESERSLSGIADDIGRRESTVKPWLQRLVDQGIVKAESEGEDAPLYSYVAPRIFRERADRFLAATRDRTNRLAIVSRVLQKEARRL